MVYQPGAPRIGIALDRLRGSFYRLFCDHSQPLDVPSHCCICPVGGQASGNPPDNDRLVLRIPWKKTPMKRRREIIVPVSVSPQEVRSIRVETRATLVAAVARGRRWL
jgi:hypothetical protein